MRVITLNKESFRRACNALAGMCGADGYRPDCLVGICKGGVYVADEVAHSFPDATRFDVALSRPSTRHKGAAFRRMVGGMSRPVQDFMRKVESRIHSLMHAERRKVRIAPLSTEFVRFLASRPEARVLIVDDAVDSGITMARLLKSLTSQFPKLRITTAVITVTTRRPAMQPDYALYNNQTLIRFPWSSDAK